MHVPSDPQDLHGRWRRIEKMKLIIQIPCLNEAETLPKIISEIPKTIEGIDTIEVLVIDDGSTDGTIRAAKASGVTRVLRHTSRKGLARAFANGLDEALKCGADIIVTECTACKMQIEHLTHKQVIHPIKLLAQIL